ncbi:hypothetical protein AOLI_G00311380 [Acnodon oligacanthus]
MDHELDCYEGVCRLRVVLYVWTLQTRIIISGQEVVQCRMGLTMINGDPPQVNVAPVVSVQGGRSENEGSLEDIVIRSRQESPLLLQKNRTGVNQQKNDLALQSSYHYSSGHNSRIAHKPP